MGREPRTELPLHRSFSPDAIGQSAGLFGFNAKRRISEVSVPTLVGGLASAQGAPLGSTEFDVLTIALRFFLIRGAPPGGWLRCSMRELVMGVYGYEGGRPYNLVGQALRNLFNVAVTLPAFDAELGEFSAGATTRTRLISHIVLRADGADVNAVADDAFWEEMTAGDAPAAVKIRFESWLAAAVRAQQGRELDYGVQRRLRGAAKTCWVLLEASRFVPAGETDVEEWRIILDRHVYSVFGLNATRLTDSRAQLEAKLDRICALDPSYLGHEFAADEHDRRRRVLIVRRATGLRRQRLLRDALWAASGVTGRAPQLQLAFTATPRGDGGGGGPP